MHQLSQYLKEREGFDSIITDNGFASYLITGAECYIRDIWVHPDFRKTKIASNMADEIVEIAKKAGCNCLIGSVYLKTTNPTASTKVLLAYGFNVHSVVQDGILFRKEI